MYKNIVIEGTKVSGKSTLAKNIVNEIGFTYEHLSSETPNTYDFHNDLLKKNNVVYDRFHIGEIIYSLYYERNPKIDFKQYNDIFKENPQTLFVILTIPGVDNEDIINKIKSRFEKRFEKTRRNYNEDDIFESYIANFGFMFLGEMINKKIDNVIYVNEEISTNEILKIIKERFYENV